jgi:hypothetical protein
MNIIDEYLLRHGLSFPIVRHSDGIVILRELQTQKLFVLSTKWITNNHHPGHYLVELRHPSYSASKQSLSNLFECRFSYEKNWSEYEDFFFSWMRNMNFVPILERKNIIISAWEIFVCCYEFWFLNGSDLFKEELFDTLDPEQSLENRFFSCEHFFNQKEFKISELSKIWEEKFLGEINNYLDWFDSLNK